MKEDKFLDDLFEQAKNAPPELSFEEVANRFETSVATTGSLTAWKEWVFNHLNLNSFIMISISSVLLTVLYLFVTPVNPVKIIENNNIQNTVTESFTEKEGNTTQTVKEGPTIKSVESTQQLAQRPPKSTKPIELTLPESLATNGNNLSPLANDNTALKTVVDELDNLPTGSIAEQPLQSSTDKHQLPESNLAEIAKTERQSNLPTSSDNIHSKSDIAVNDDSKKRKKRAKDRGRGRGRGVGIGTSETVWKEKTKFFQKEYDLSTAGTTQIISEFGEIDIQPWNENKVKIVATATVSAHKEKITERVLENIDVAFSKKGDKVKAETKVSNKKAIRWNNRKNWEVSIDYEIFVPQSSTIDIEHIHGDLVIGEFLGKSKLKLEFANLTADNIGKEADIKLMHSQGIIKNGETLLSNLAFSEITAEKLGTVELNLNNSIFKAKETANVSGHFNLGTLKFGKIKDYNLEGTGGEIDIKKAEKVNLKHRFTKISIDSALDISAKMEFGSFYGKSLGNIDLDLTNGNFKAKKAKSVKGNSKGGQLDLGSIDRYENNSNGTEVQIDKVNTVETEGQFTKLTIDEVIHSLNVNFEFGNCNANINNLSPQVNITGKNAHFDLKVPTNAQFQFDMISNTKNYSFPRDIQLSRRIEKVTHHEAQGFLGDSTVQNILKANLILGKFELERRDF